VSCGDVITGDAMMTADLVCGLNDPALTVNGGALDMNGHRISGCLGDGIVLAGNAAQLQDGSVDGCNIAVRVEGGGGHQIRAVVASDSILDGFRITSSGNKLANTSAVGNGDDGYDIAGDRNTLKANGGLNNFAAGFRLSGARNKLNENLASSNGGDGYTATGDGNKLIRNLSESNGGRNFLISGDENQLSQNSAVRSTFEAGIEIVGDKNKLSKNVVVNSGNGNDSGFLIAGNENRLGKNSSSFNTDAGFEIGGSDNVLAACKAIDNAGVGIEVTAGAANGIKRNRVAKSTGEGIRLRSGVTLAAVLGNVSLENSGDDLRDDNADCGDNRWENNVEATANPASCVQ
jgi:hypothetical protein